MAALLDRLGLEAPVFQAGMGAGLSMHELAAAVSAAGGLGTIGHLEPGGLRREIAAARRITDRPVAANLLLPFARDVHFEAASAADVVVTFWGSPRRRTSKPWIHQCGSVEEAVAAHHAGADAVIAQGAESGGHVRGSEPGPRLLERVREALPDAYPVLSAGGIAERADVRVRLGAGAEAVVCGTRFLMSEESGAHPEYKRRLVDGSETLVTELFGNGWPATQRVLPNAATERWLKHDSRGPRWMRAFNRATAPLLSRVPVPVELRIAAVQRPGVPVFTPAAALASHPASLVDAGPLYAGETVARLTDIRPAAELVGELSP